MKIKDYTDMVGHLTDPFNIPEARRMIAENPALTQEQFKAGGIVEPGVTHYALTNAERVARYRAKHPEKAYKTTQIDFTSKGEKITVDVPHLKASSKAKFKELIKGVEKWKTEPTTENWFKIFRKATGSGKGPQQYSHGWSTELRKFLRGEKTEYAQIGEIFKQTDIKNVLGLDDEHVKLIKSYKNLKSTAIAQRIAAEKHLYNSAEKAIQINNIFKTNPNITLKDLAGKIYGKDFAKAGFQGQHDMMNAASNNVARYLEVLDGGREIPKGLKSKWVPPTGKNFNKIKDYIFSQSHGFRFQEQTLRRYKYAIRDSILKLKPNTSRVLEAKLAKIKGAVDHIVSLSAVYKEAPGYLEAIQKIEGSINAAKSAKIDKPFGEALKLAFKGDFSKVDAYNKMAAEWAKTKNIDVPFIRPGGDPTQTVKYFTEFSDAAQENILESAKKTGVAIETKKMPLTEKTVFKIKQSLSSQIQNMDGKTLAQYKKFYPKCFEQDVGGNALKCLTKQAEKNSELFTKNSVSIAKATEGTKTSAQMLNFLSKAKMLARGTGWLLAGEAVFAPLLTMGPYAKGKTWKRSMSDALYGLNKKWSLGLAESEADEIRENAGQLGYDAWKMKQIDAERKATMEKLNNIEQSDTQYGRGQGSYNTFVLTDKLEKLTKEYDDLSQQFLSGEVDAEGNSIGNELFDTALNNLTAGTQQIEKFDKQRVGERQQRWQKVGRTLMDKPREKFIDFTLGPKWKENLPQYPSSTKYPHSPTTLGQHLSYDPDIPTFAEGGIASLKKK